LLLGLLLGSLLALGSCASVRFTRDTKTSGTYVSTGLALTVISIDLPKSALQIARENAADARLANMTVEDVRVVPYLGWFDWLLDIFGVRWARVSGRWGFPGDDLGD
jgi:hypothetical protein